MGLMLAVFLGGLMVGVVLTGLFACYVYGLLHGEAVRALDEQAMGFALAAVAFRER